MDKTMRRITAFIAIAACALSLCFCAACSSEGGDKPEQPLRNDGYADHERIYLYEENNVPYATNRDCRRYVFLTPYLAEYPNGAAVLVFPGGAYKHLSNSSKDADGGSRGVDNDGEQREASDIAEWYNAAGISVFVVNYRTKNTEPNISYLQLMSDGARAVRHVRKFAQSYCVDPDKIAVQGYSAGGHLAAMLCTQGENEWRVADEGYTPDETDAVSSRPNAGVLGYAVSSLQTNTHTTTRNNFCNGVASSDLTDFRAEYSAENRITEKTCPMFLWHEKGDGTVPYGASQALHKALVAANIECELHLFNDRGDSLHGIGCAQSYDDAREWPALATDFLKTVLDLE